MRCEDVQPLISVYVDGELDLMRNVEVERHLETCGVCAPAYRETAQLSSAIRKSAPYYRAPQNLEARIRAAVQEPESKVRSMPAAPVRTRTWRWIGIAAALVLAVLLTRVALLRIGASQQQFVAQEVVAGHVRSLMANHLMDVVSTDQHTVKPWFHGKLDFAPPVDDFAAQGFALVGGRLDYLDGRPVAALVYQRRLHYINLFIWPSAKGESNDVAEQMRDGYDVLHWAKNGMTYWAVSDLADDDMRTFVALLRK